VSKFVGKFRKNKDYNDDYNYARSFLHSKKRRGEHPEVKKQMKHYQDEEYEEVFVSQGKKY
jgi:hypothetical protein